MSPTQVNVNTLLHRGKSGINVQKLSVRNENVWKWPWGQYNYSILFKNKISKQKMKHATNNYLLLNDMPPRST